MKNTLKVGSRVTVQDNWGYGRSYEAIVEEIDKQGQNVDSISLKDLNRSVVIFFKDVKKWAYGFQIKNIY